MTTYQDPPLHSRRSVRQTERDESRPDPVPHTSAPSMPVAPAETPAEPLTYATQSRSSVPSYDGPNFRASYTPVPASDTSPDAPASTGASVARDFSPEGRQAASASGTPSPFAPHPPAAPVVIPSALDNEYPVEHTMTRRELRALREAGGFDPAGGESGPVNSVAAPKATPVAPPTDPGTPLAAPSTRLDSALAEFDELTAGRPAPAQTDVPAPRGRRAAEMTFDPAASPVSSAPVPLVEPPVSAPIPAAASPVPDVVTPAAPPVSAAPTPFVAPAASTAPPSAAFPQTFDPEPVVEATIEPTPAPAAAPAPVEITVVETAAVIDSSVASGPSPRVGHWSTQADLDDETQTGEGAHSRNFGAGAITTSALVLPSIPSHEFGPLASGEVMVTGSFSLPQSMSATGAHPTQLDESDLDNLLDPGDNQVVSTDSQPVRAIRAVSTHTSSRGLINNSKPKGTRGLTALIIAATGMAVVVGALFIVLVVTGQL